MELEQAILTRRSVRRFKDEQIPDEVIHKLLVAAQAAPSGGNGQAHVFGVVRDPAMKRALAEAAGNQMWIAGAPVVIACCARLETELLEPSNDTFASEVDCLRWGEPFWRYLAQYPKRSEVARLLANATPLIPAEHIALTAVANGLSSCFVGWLDVEKASAVLRLPEDIRCLFLLPIGYADEQPKPKTLKSISEISFLDSYID